MSQGFIKNVEDFKCENCGEEVMGDGYTNHCPECLWSKHVDVFPGDRAALCGGLMRPAELEHVGSPESRIIHQCTLCGYKKANKVAAQDKIDPGKFIC